MLILYPATLLNFILTDFYFLIKKNWGLLWVFIAAHELSVVVAVNGSYSLVVVFRFLLVMASLVVEHRL